MVTDQAIRGKRRLPALPRELWMSVRSAVAAVPPRVVVMAVLPALIVGSGFAYLGQRAVRDARLLSAQQAAQRRVERANLALSKKLASLEDELGAATRKREAAERQLEALSGQSGLLRGLLLTAQTKLNTLDRAQNTLSDEANAIERQLSQSQHTASSKQSRIVGLQQALGSAQRKLHEARAERATLSARLAQLQGEEAKAKKREAAYRASLDRWERELRKAITERDQLRARLAQKLSEHGVHRLRQRFASARPESGRSETASERARWGDGVLARFKRVLASTGVDVRGLFAKFGANSAEGGPFVPPPKGGMLPDQLTAKQLAVLGRVAKALPLSAPLHHYRLTSPFGLRRSPFNGREEFHTGDDLAAPYMTPVYSPAPGTVIYAGWKRGGYGKLVEINDGNGVTTWFAHLHRYTVLVGEHVAAHTQIGYIGTTGESTGPHLHYEIRVNGHPQNPMKFMRLGRLLRTTVARR